MAMLTVKEVRNLMRNCSEGLVCSHSIEFKGEDDVSLVWSWQTEDGWLLSHTVHLKINQLTISNKNFQKEIHKAKFKIKRALR